MAVDILEALRQGYMGQEIEQPDISLLDDLAAGAKIEQPRPQPPGMMEQVLAGAVAIPETAAALATGIGNAVIGGYAGIPVQVAESFGLVPEHTAAKVVESIAQPYQPKGKVAQQAVEAAMKPFEIIHESADWWGHRVADATGNPELGALAAFAVEGGAVLLGPKLAKSTLKITSREARVLRRSLESLRKTGEFRNPEATKILEKIKSTAEKNPRFLQIARQYADVTKRQPAVPPGGVLPTGGRAPLDRPTANELVRQRMERRRMADVAGVELPPEGAKFPPQPPEPGEQTRMFTEEVTGKAEPKAEEPPIPTQREVIDQAVAELSKAAQPPRTAGEAAAIAEFGKEVEAKAKAKPKITYEQQAEKSGIKFIEEVVSEDPEAKGTVGRFFDPETGQYFNANSPTEVRLELRELRKSIADRQQKYANIRLEDFGPLVQEWYSTGKGDIIAIKQEIMDFVNGKPKSDFRTNADYVEFLERGEEFLGIINNMIRQRAPKPTIGKGAPPKDGLVVAAQDIDGKIYYGKKGQTHAELLDEHSLWDKVLYEGQGFAGPDGKFLTREAALETLPLDQAEMYKAYRGSKDLPADILESGLYEITGQEVAAKLTDGNISEPKMIEPKDRIAYMKEFQRKRGNLTQEQLEAMIEEGVDLTEKLPPQSRDAYRSYKELQDFAEESSEPRGIGEVLSDVRTYLGDETGAVGDLGKMSFERRQALQRLMADAKRMVGDLTDYLTSLGFSPEQIAIIKRNIDEIRKIEPETFNEVRQHWIDARAIAQGDKIVKQRKPGRSRQSPPVYESEVKMIQDAKELPYSRTGRGFENPIRTLEQADPTGEGLKQVYYDYREAEQLYRREFEGVKKDIAEMRKGVGWSSRKRIGAFAIAQQARGRNILARMGVEVPRLTELEIEKYQAIRDRFDKLFERINTMREMIGKEPIEKVDNYFTFFRTFSTLDRAGITSNPVLDKPSVIASRYAKYGSTPFRYGIERIKKGAIPVELDPFRIYEKYTETALRHIHLSPWIAKMRELMLSLPDPKTGKMSWKLEAHKPNLNEFLVNWVNHIAGYPSKWQLPRPFERGLSMINRNIAFAVLGANARSALIQVSALRNTVAEIGFKHAAEGVIDSITDISRGFESRRFALENSKILDGRAFDAAVQDAMSVLRGGRIGAVQEALGRFTLKPLQWLDMETAIASWNGAYKLAKSKGMNHKRSVNFADDVVTRTQASALPGDIAPVQRSVLGKTFTLFQTFVINDWGFLTRDVLGLGNVSMKNDIALKKVMTYVAATTMFNTLFNASGIQSPFPTPVRDLKDSIEKGDPLDITALKVAFGLLDPIPVIGSARYGRGPGGPTAEAIGEAVKSLRGAPMAKPVPEALAVFTGIPGVAQAGKSVRARKRGEGLYGQIIGRYEPKEVSLTRKHGLSGLKGMEGLRGF